MIKMFCDGCGKELQRNYVSRRLRKILYLNGLKFAAEITVSTEDVPNAGDLCRECVMVIIRTGGEE